MCGSQKTDTSKGIKYDSGKPRWELLPLATVEEIVLVMTFGAKKYGDFNWQKVAPERFHGALLRHLTAWNKGEILDDDPQNKTATGCSHMAQVACNAIFLLWMEQNEEELIRASEEAIRLGDLGWTQYGEEEYDLDMEQRF